MDKRYHPMPVAEQVLVRRQAIEEVLAHPEWTLADAIRHLKQSMRLTSAELAKLAGLSHRTVQDIEQGRSEGTVQTMNRLLGIVGLKLGVVRRVSKDQGGG
ncbi:MAG: helix-turn-helix domain-containing protein [Sphaerotilus sp.]|jgi:DNA-binding XRE family transcriptional regulator|nr:helix-turn-helix domain-containing protein [Sphaerotilus sp.]